MNDGAVALLLVDGGRCDFSSADHEGQRAIRQLAYQKGFDIRAFLAVKPRDLQAGINHALMLCQTEKARCLIFENPQSLILMPKQLVSLLELLHERGIALAFAAHPQLLMPEHSDILRVVLLASMKALHHHRSQSIKRSLKHMKKQGMSLGGRRFGANEREERMAAQIVGMHRDGLSLQKICDLLSLSDIKTVQNKRWHPTTIKRIIERNG